MAKKIIWSNEATADLKALAEYISRDSTFYAKAFVQKIIEVSKTLDKFSLRGRVVPELNNSNIRELFVKEYRLIYYIKKSEIIILGIVHGKRDLNKKLKNENEV